ncbi:MAG: signal peptidase II [Candidatus Krumholzibacteriia bacterium]|jgi:signal peptidase II
MSNVASRAAGFRPWLWTPLIFVVDLVSKQLVLANEATLRGQVNIIGEFARFIYVRNPGSAMGLFPVGRWTLVGVSIVASLFIIYLYRSTDSKLKVRLGAMAAILGGALGNLLDRIFYDGQVVDFIDMGFGSHRFYTFNVADIGVSIGGVILFLCILLEGRQQQDTEADAS